MVEIVVESRLGSGPETPKFGAYSLQQVELLQSLRQDMLVWFSVSAPRPILFDPQSLTFVNRQMLFQRMRIRAHNLLALSRARDRLAHEVPV